MDLSRIVFLRVLVLPCRRCWCGGRSFGRACLWKNFFAGLGLTTRAGLSALMKAEFFHETSLGRWTGEWQGANGRRCGPLAKLGAGSALFTAKGGVYSVERPLPAILSAARNLRGNVGGKVTRGDSSVVLLRKDSLRMAWLCRRHFLAELVSGIREVSLLPLVMCWARGGSSRGCSRSWGSAACSGCQPSGSGRCHRAGAFRGSQQVSWLQAPE